MNSICIIDTGVKPHVDFMVPTNRIVKFIDIVGMRTHPYDDNGHGTFVTSLCAGNGIMSGHKIVGADPYMNVVSIKAFDKMGKAKVTDVLHALDIVDSIKDIYNIDVILMCFGIDAKSKDCTLLYEKIHDITSQNVSIVAASGNDNSSINVPAVYDEVISVGSIDGDGNISTFSSKGDNKPYFYALGEDVVGLDIEGFVSMSGTSMAAPYVASIVMYIKRELGSIPNSEVMRILYNISTEHNGINIL